MVDLDHAYFERADLYRANLDHSDFDCADLEHAFCRFGLCRFGYCLNTVAANYPNTVKCSVAQILAGCNKEKIAIGRDMGVLM